MGRPLIFFNSIYIFIYLFFFSLSQMTAKMLKEANQLNKLDFEIAEAEKEKTAIGLKIKENKELVESKGEALKESWLDQCVRFFLATVHCSLFTVSVSVSVS